MNLQEFTAEWNAVTLFKIFEVEVIDHKTNEHDWITFDISLDGNKFVAQHEPLTAEQEASNKIAFVEIDIDTDFSLDENLQELLEDCNMAVIDSDFFNVV